MNDEIRQPRLARDGIARRRRRGVLPPVVWPRGHDYAQLFAIGKIVTCGGCRRTWRHGSRVERGNVMKRFWQFVGLSCMALMAASFCGCGGTAGSGPKKLRLAVIPKGTSHDFWYSVHAGAQQADDDFDDLTIVWKGPTSEGDTAEQIKLVESFLADGYDGICLAPLDAVALRKPVEAAERNKTPVVIFDSGLTDNTGVVSYVATNNYRGGERAGDYLVELLQGRGKVILMRYDVNSLSTEEREQGFLDALAKHPQIELLKARQARRAGREATPSNWPRICCRTLPGK